MIFMQTLAELLNHSNIAADEYKYIVTYDYLGFFQKCDNTVWVNKEKVWTIICETIRNRGIEWLETLDSMANALHHQGYIHVKEWEENGTPHVSHYLRAKKGTRKTMLVFFKEKIEKFGGLQNADWNQF